MKKKLTLFTVLTAIAFTSHAQVNTSNKTTEEVLFNRHQIRLYQTPDNQYGYDILFENAVILHQNNHPFANTSIMLKTKEDAIRLAKWQVIHISPLNGRRPLISRPIPNEVSRQLKISTN